MQSLWPKLEKVELNTPKAILAQQAECFNELQTGLQAYISSSIETADQWPTVEKAYYVHTLRIKASGMSGFTLTLLRIMHDPIEIYPARVTNVLDEKSVSVKNEAELMESLKTFFQAKGTVTALQNLISQNK